MFRVDVLKFLENDLFVFSSMIDEAFLASLTRMHAVDLLERARFVLNHRFPNEFPVSLEGPSLQFDAEFTVLLDDIVEVVSTNGLAVHVRDGTVEKFGAAAEHD